MNAQHEPIISRCRRLPTTSRRVLALAALLFAAACGQPGDRAPQAQSADEWREFEGSWTAAGTRQTINLGAESPRVDLRSDRVAAANRGTGAWESGSGRRRSASTDSLAGMQGRCVWTDERGDQVYSELKGEWVGTGNRIVGTFLGGTGRYAGVTGEYTLPMAIRDRIRGRRRERAGRRPQGPRARLSSAAAAQEDAPNDASHPALERLVKQVLSVRPGARHLVHADTGGADERGLASVRHLRGGDLLGHSERIPAPDGLAARGGGTRAYPHGRPRQGLRRLRQRERAPRRGRLPRRQRGREVGARTAHQPACGERIRAIHARAGLQHLSHRCLDRAGVSEQHGARRRALPDHPFPGPKLPAPCPTTRASAGWAATSCSAAWRASASPRPCGSPPPPANPIGGLAGGAIRREDRLRLVVPGRVGSGADDDPSASRSSSTACFRPA